MSRAPGRDNSHVEPALRQFLPPCQIKCPIHEDIQRTNVLISLLPIDPVKARDAILEIGDYLFDRNPFFSVCAYVCGICELGCTYAGTGGAIRRRLLKRFIAENYRDRLKETTPFARTDATGRVAVIGAGPAGLMAAFELARRGYDTTLFEASDRPGGALSLIPHYRLPQEVLSDSIDAIVRVAGITLLLNSPLGEKGFDLDLLREQGFSAIFIASGSPSPRILTYDRIEVSGQRLPGVMYGHTFLYELAHNAVPEGYLNGCRVIIAGGGNVAFDAARSARRLGAETRLVCLECADRGSRDGILAEPQEVKGAMEEGVQIIFSRGISAINEMNGVFRSVVAPRCIGVFDDNGFNPRFNLDDTMEITGDILIIAVGQGPERIFLQHEGLLDDRGKLAADPLTLESSRQRGVFIGGDMLRIGFMVDAMRDGLEAAESIDRYIRGIDLRSGRQRDYASPPPPIRHQYRAEPDLVWIPPIERIDFNLFEQGFSLPEAIAEAKRCLECGPCVSCKACIVAGIQDDLPRLETDEERCSGCGICITACPYGAASLTKADNGLISSSDELLCRGCGLCVAACPAAARRLAKENTKVRFDEIVNRLKVAQP